MRRLMLLRHAKSDWSDPDMRDIDRPLNARGFKAARTVEWLKGKRQADPSVRIMLAGYSRAVRIGDRILVSGTPDEIKQNDEVRAVYLGDEEVVTS